MATLTRGQIKLTSRASPETLLSLLNLVVDASNDWIWGVDTKTFHLVSFNKSFADYYLKTRGVWLEIGMVPEDLLPVEFAEMWRQLYRRALAQGTVSMDYEVYGGARMLHLDLYRFDAYGVIYAIGRDITTEKRTSDELAGVLSFQRLVDELAGKLVRTPDHARNEALEDALARFCEHLDLDGSLLWDVVGPDQLFRVASVYQLVPGPSWVGASRRQDLPWTQAQLLRGEAVVIPATSDLPTEASADRQTWQRLGIKSAVVLPLTGVRGEPIGALAFVTVGHERAWPPHILERLSVVAHLVANIRLLQASAQP